MGLVYERSIELAYGVPDSSSTQKILATNTVSGVTTNPRKVYRLVSDIPIHFEFSTTASADTNSEILPAGLVEYFGTGEASGVFSVVRNGTVNGICWITPMIPANSYVK